MCVLDRAIIPLHQRSLLARVGDVSALGVDFLDRQLAEQLAHPGDRRYMAGADGLECARRHPRVQGFGGVLDDGDTALTLTSGSPSTAAAA
jgi:hypothetical protein